MSKSRVVCVYSITFPTAEEKIVYIGQTIRFKDRRNFHMDKSKERTPYTGSPLLYNWMKARRREGHEPEFTILEECPQELLNEREDFWQAYYDELGWESKHCRGGEQQFIKDETRQKMSESAKRRPRRSHSEETKLKIGLANKGIVRTPEQVEQNRQGHLGQRWSPQQRAKHAATMKKKKENATIS